MPHIPAEERAVRVVSRTERTTRPHAAARCFDDEETTKPFGAVGEYPHRRAFVTAVDAATAAP